METESLSEFVLQEFRQPASNDNAGFSSKRVWSLDEGAHLLT